MPFPTPTIMVLLEDMEPLGLLHSLKISELPNHRLDLKVGVSVILLGNLNQ